MPAEAVPHGQRRQPPLAAGTHVANVVRRPAVGGQGGHFARTDARGVEKVGQALSGFHQSGVHHKAVPHHPKAVRGLRHRRFVEAATSGVAFAARGPGQEQGPQRGPGGCPPTCRHESCPNTSFKTHPLPHSLSSVSLQCSGKNTRFWNLGGRYFCQFVPPVAARSTGSLWRYLTALL